MIEAPSPSAPHVGRTAATIAPLVIAGRGTAFLVPIVVAGVFGAIPATDAFFFALALPAFVMIVAANAVAPALTPAVARLEEASPGQVGPFVASAALVSGAVAASVALVATGAAAVLLNTVGGFSAETRHQTLIYALALVPFAGLTGATVPLRVGAEVAGAFAGSATAALIRGGVVIAAIVALSRPLGTDTLPIAYALGQIAEVAWYLRLLARRGRIAGPGPLGAPWRDIGAGLVPLAIAQGLTGLGMAIDRAFASRLVEGSVSLLEYADRTRFIPQTLLESTLVAVAFATWSRLVARGDHVAYARQLDQSLRWAIAWSAPVVAGLFVGRHLLVRTLYVRGAFTTADADQVAGALGGFAPGLVGIVVTLLVGRSLVIEGRGRAVIALSATHLALNVVLDAALTDRFQLPGIGAANAIAMLGAATVAAGFARTRLRGVSRAADWARTGAVALASVGVAGAAAAFGAPVEWTDPSVFTAAAAGAALVALAAFASQR